MKHFHVQSSIYMLMQQRDPAHGAIRGMGNLRSHFQWLAVQIYDKGDKACEVLSLTGVQPLFGHLTGRRGLTHWFVFMKPRHFAEVAV